MSGRDVPGRGTAANPPNRYETLHLDLDDRDEDAFADEEPGRLPTVFYRDTSRSILAENDSPDVGFRFSLNPYRGCEHGCVYCLAPDTPILHADMTWRPIGEAQVGDVLFGFDEFPAPGRTRKLRRALVEAVWWSRKPTVRLVTEGARVQTTAEHRWLDARGFRWSRTDRLSPGARLRHVPVTSQEPVDDDYRLGYVAGLSLGNGTSRDQPGWRRNRLGFPMAYWRVALVDDAPLERLVAHLRCFGVDPGVRPFFAGAPNRKPLRKVEVRSLARLAVLHGIVNVERDTRAYRRGFLAGFFDAGGHSGDSLRISQVELGVLARVQRYARSLGFDFVLEPRAGAVSTLRLKGRLIDRLRFFSVCQPAIARRMHALFGHEMNFDVSPVHTVEPGPVRDVVDIQTSTGTFVAAGLATHNCYARPSHEYLGFSAGLDFERRIMVKDGGIL